MSEMRVIVNETDLINIANSIRAKTEKSDKLTFPDGFISAIDEVSVGGNENSFVTTTIMDSEIDYSFSLTISELIGAKYFIIQGNYISAYQAGSLDVIDNSGVIHTVIYINGRLFLYYAYRGVSPTVCDMTSAEELTDGWSFDETTGTINFEEYFFNKFTNDASTGNVSYTVYRFG